MLASHDVPWLMLHAGLVNLINLMLSNVVGAATVRSHTHTSITAHNAHVPVKSAPVYLVLVESTLQTASQHPVVDVNIVHPPQLQAVLPFQVLHPLLHILEPCLVGCKDIPNVHHF